MLIKDLLYPVYNSIRTKNYTNLGWEEGDFTEEELNTNVEVEFTDYDSDGYEIVIISGLDSSYYSRENEIEETEDEKSILLHKALEELSEEYDFNYEITMSGYVIYKNVNGYEETSENYWDSDLESCETLDDFKEVIVQTLYMDIDLENEEEEE